MGFCYQKNFSHPTLPVDEAQFYALVRATQWNQDIDKYRETGEASLKRKLPAFIFQATFDETESAKGKLGAWRKQSATRLTGLVVMDIDHVENPREVFERWHLATDDRTDRTRKNDILLVYITPSGKGLKVVFKADASVGNLIDNQHAMAEILGVEVDESCKDASRMSFICKESDILFIDKELFTYENKEFSDRFTALYRDGHSQATNEHEQTSSGSAEEVPELQEITWRGYDVQCIIDARYADKLPCAADSNRHTESLKLARPSRGYRKSSRKGVKMSAKPYPLLLLVLARRKRNILIICLQRRCSKRSKRPQVKRFRKSRRRKRRRTYRWGQAPVIGRRRISAVGFGSGVVRLKC